MSQTSLNFMKGAAYKSIIDALVEMHGVDKFNQILDSEYMDKNFAETIRSNTILASAWYDTACLRSLYTAYVSLPFGTQQSVYEVNDIATSYDLTKGVYKVFIMLINPNTFVRLGAMVINKYLKYGTMHVAITKTNEIKCTYDIPGHDDNTWMGVFGGCVGGLKCCGAKNVRYKIILDRYNIPNKKTVIYTYDY